MRRFALALMGAAGIVASACGGAASSSLPEVRVTMTDFKFAPNPIEIPAGRMVEFKLTNSGSVEHDLTAKGIGFHARVPAAKRESVPSGPFTAGTYDIYCALPGHREAGMIGRIVVK